MKGKILQLTVLMMLLSVFSVFAATPTLVAPVANDRLGPQNLVTVNFTCFDCNNGTAYNAAGYAISSTTANSSLGDYLFNISSINFSGNSNVTATFNTSLLEDGGKYNLTLILQNASGDRAERSVFELQIDNGVPTAPSSCSVNDFQNTTYSLSCSVTNSQTTNCSISFPNGGPTQSSNSAIPTYSADRCALVVDGSATGTFYYIMSASDNLNSTAHAGSYFTVSEQSRNGDVGGGGGGAAALSVAQQQLAAIPTQVGAAVTGKDEGSLPEVTKTVSGAALGFVAGSIVPVVGNIVGAVIGAIIGFIM